MCIKCQISVHELLVTGICYIVFNFVYIDFGR